ncbi:hypothetical protein GQ53DRAFT_816947 [Thozetella sp. PMI_491]|nr:hypothetical protein GQ53DRAFT_816947 [Thozetella sp. PMI_491]
MVVSCGCMVTIVYILLRNQNADYALWLFPISLNTMIAIFTTIARITLLASVTSCLGQEKWLYFKKGYRQLHHLTMFDAATRGPNGAIALLFSIPRSFAALGASVLVLSFVKDAFTQQVVQFESMNVYDNNTNASFAYTRTYNSGAATNMAYFDYPPNIDGAIDDLSMQGAIFRGLYQDPWTPVFSCSSNCRWDGVYTLVGFSSNCQNVTDATLETKSCTTGEDVAEGVSTNRTECIMTTPGGVTIVTKFVPKVSNSYVIVNATSLLRDGEVLQQSEFLRAAVWNSTRGYADTTYNLEKGIIRENVMECTLSVMGFNYTDLHSESGQLLFSTTPISLGKVVRTENLTIISPAKTPLQVVNCFDVEGTAFRANQGDISSLVNFFTSSTFCGEMVDTLSRQASQAGVTQAFFQRDVRAVFDNLARSMTNQVQQGGDGQNLAYGLTSRSTIFVRLQWSWFILPLVVQCGGVVLLIATIFKNRRENNVPLWKTSPTALLFHRIEKGEIMTTDVQSLAELRSLEKEMVVTLE